MLRSPIFVFATLILAARITVAGDEENAQGLDALPEIEFSALSSHDQNPLSAKALALDAKEWKHGETEHFIYHFMHSYVATPISVEAEFCFRVIAEQLGPETSPGPDTKSQIYIFEKPEDWKAFQASAHLELWTGGIHSRGSLFIVRDPAYKFADNSLGHEIAHLMLFRRYQHPLPRWLDEGFAEYTSRVARASYQRARNYIAAPHSPSIPSGQLIPLPQLVAMVDYPPADRISVFYHESERLVRFLVATDRAAFLALLDDIARGESFEAALSRNYGSRFADVAALETEFTAYASKDAIPASSAN
ncbi:MAG: peptidase MA family metallohydrolase [Chthoniobacterales bacterium]